MVVTLPHRCAMRFGTRMTSTLVDRQSAIRSRQARVRAVHAIVQYPGSLDLTDPYSAAMAVATDVCIAIVECEAVKGCLSRGCCSAINGARGDHWWGADVNGAECWR